MREKCKLDIGVLLLCELKLFYTLPLFTSVSVSVWKRKTFGLKRYCDDFIIYFSLVISFLAFLQVLIVCAVGCTDLQDRELYSNAFSGKILPLLYRTIPGSLRLK